MLVVSEGIAEAMNISALYPGSFNAQYFQLTRTLQDLGQSVSAYLAYKIIVQCQHSDTGRHWHIEFKLCATSLLKLVIEQI